MDRRRFVIGTAATALAAGPAFAQEVFPAHAITIINAFPPGGINDLVTRPLAAAMEPILKQPVVVEAKAGAAGQVGAQFVASAKPEKPRPSGGAQARRVSVGRPVDRLDHLMFRE